MPQRQELTWKQLRVGALVAVSLIVLSVGIFFISGQVGFLTRKMTLRCYLPSAAGVKEGSDVDVAGITAGTVSKLRISNDQSPARAVEVVMRVSRRFANDIRADSVAAPTTAGLLGDSYVDISRGSPGQPQVPDGGEVKTHLEASVQNVVQNANDVVTNLRDLSKAVQDMTNQINSGKGSLGKLIYDPTLYNKISHSADVVDRMADQMVSGQSTLGKLVNSNEAYDKLIAAMDRLNRLLDQAEHGNGTVAKLMNDPSLYNRLNDVTTKAGKLVTDIDNGKGTLGKLVKDEQLYDRLNQTVEHLNVISARMAKGEGSLGLLSTDSKLYSNLTASSESLKEFLADFRKEPKKYLSIKLHIF
ncbi:MAG TPA: MlaD family protein [Terriglobia bacterium]|nr:MlaD family protein [Terriglobia bacterium]